MSPSTVSRAFSRPGRVSAVTTERIRAAASRIGYRTEPVARARALTRTSLIAVVVSDIANPVYFPVIRGAEQAAAEAGLSILVRDSQESAPGERAGIDQLLALVDGVVLAGTRMSDAAVRTIAGRIPVVLLNRVVPGVPAVVTGSEAAMAEAVEHLAGLGHRSISYVAGPPASWADGVRWRSVQESAHRIGLGVHRIGPFTPTVLGGEHAASELLKHRPTAVLAYNDLLAIGLLRGLSRAGVGVPAEISVVGWDNIFGSDFCAPPLTTVSAPLRALGTVAVQRLAGLIAGAESSAAETPTRLPAQLVIRESTAPPRRGPGPA